MQYLDTSCDIKLHNLSNWKAVLIAIGVLNNLDLRMVEKNLPYTVNYNDN